MQIPKSIIELPLTLTMLPILMLDALLVCFAEAHLLMSLRNKTMYEKLSSEAPEKEDF